MLRLLPRNTRPLTPQAAAALLPYQGTAAQLLYARGIETAAEAEVFLHPSLDKLHDPMEMQDMDKAAQRLQQALQQVQPRRLPGAPPGRREPLQGLRPRRACGLRCACLPLRR